MSESMSKAEYLALYSALRSSLPPSVHEPQWKRGALALIACAGCIGLVVFLHILKPVGPLAFLVSLVISQLYVYAGFVNHESQHGSVFKSKALIELLAWLSFSAYFISPNTWRAWHDVGHHGNTNVPRKDPDFMGLTQDVRGDKSYQFFNMIAPGSRHWTSFISLFVLFNFKGQAVVWHHARLFFPKRFNLGRAKLETLSLILFWVCLSIYLGSYTALFGILIPTLIANFTIMSYIITQHWLSPISTQNHPIEITVSVRTLKVFDLIHANFSYHLEHHLFPDMSPRFAPLVRERLKAFSPQTKYIVDHWRAIYWLYATPRTYESERVLSHWKSDWKVNTSWLRDQLRLQ